MIAESNNELEKDLEILRLRREIQRLERNLKLERERAKRPHGRLTELLDQGQGVYGSPDQIEAHLREERDSWG
jgi:hypothetical protein